MRLFSTCQLYNVRTECQSWPFLNVVSLGEINSRQMKKCFSESVVQVFFSCSVARGIRHRDKLTGIPCRLTNKQEIAFLCFIYSRTLRKIFLLSSINFSCSFNLVGQVNPAKERLYLSGISRLNKGKCKQIFYLIWNYLLLICHSFTFPRCD